MCEIEPQFEDSNGNTLERPNALQSNRYRSMQIIHRGPSNITTLNANVKITETHLDLHQNLNLFSPKEENIIDDPVSQMRTIRATQELTRSRFESNHMLNP